MDNNNNHNTNDILHNNNVNINVGGPSAMIDDTNAALSNTNSQPTNSYCSMVNVQGDQSNSNDFFSYYFNSSGVTNNVSNHQLSNNNPQTTTNILHQQHAYLDDPTSSLHDIQHMSSNIQSFNTNLASQMHNPHYMYIDPSNEQQTHLSAQHMPSISSNKVDSNSYMQPQYNNVAPNNPPMYDTSGGSSRNGHMRISSYVDPNGPYINTSTQQQSTSPSNKINNTSQVNHHTIMPNYSGYVVSYPPSQPNLPIGPIPGVYSKASPKTVLWLLENYESAEGVSLPRCLLYAHYIYHCKQSDSNPVNSASFGKLIRSLFLNLKTRRLGTRGKSKYHYYGIRIRDTSILHSFGRSEDEVIDFLAVENEAFLKKILPQHPALLKSMSQSGSDQSANSELSLTHNSTTGNTINSNDSSVGTSPSTILSKASQHVGIDGRQRASVQIDDYDSVINISLKNEVDMSVQDTENNTHSTLNPGSNGGKAIDYSYFTIEQFYKYFPNQTQCPLTMSNPHDYPTLSSYVIDIEPLSDFEYDNYEVFINNGDKPGSSIKTNPVCRLKHFLRYSASKLIPLVIHIDTALFLQQTEDNMRRLDIILENVKDDVEESRAMHSIFECDDVIELNMDLDVLIYQFLVHRLFPMIFYDYPSHYINCLRAFTRKLEKTVIESSSKLPEAFRLSKIQNVKAFGSIIRHYTCLSHIYTGAVNCINQERQIKLSAEMTKIDIDELIHQHESVIRICSDKKLYTDAAKKLATLLNKQMDENTNETTSQVYNEAQTDDLDLETRKTMKRSIDNVEKIDSDIPLINLAEKTLKGKRVKEILGWMKNVKNKYFKQLYKQGFEKPTNSEQYCKIFQKFTTIWNHIVVLVVRELTVQGSQVFGLMHICHLLLFEYIPHMQQQDLFESYNILPIYQFIKVLINCSKCF